MLGEGFYGRVLHIKTDHHEYCVKEPRNFMDHAQKKNLFEQILFCSKLEYSNVLGILHVTTNAQNVPLVILAYMRNGCLVDFLRDEQRQKNPLSLSLVKKFTLA